MSSKPSRTSALIRKPPRTSALIALDALEHYSLYQPYVCTAPNIKRGARSANERLCGKVFPNAQLLALHLSERHGSLTYDRQDRHERTFTPSPMGRNSWSPPATWPSQPTLGPYGPYDARGYQYTGPYGTPPPYFPTNFGYTGGWGTPG
ncbi:hypothetical protein FRC04_002501 [Tulasnella sp. 424]|nr:hypothetical protein FRC04_002501 [Tulasnella sp. 424]